MERAMGYVNDFTYRAEEYAQKAGEGTKEDTEAAREKEELERELAIQRGRSPLKPRRHLAGSPYYIRKQARPASLSRAKELPS